MVNNEGINPELWEFPHNMVLKVMGHAELPVRVRLLEVVEQFNIEHKPESIKERTSSKGNYRSISIHICLASKEQCENLYLELHRLPEFKVVL